MDEPVSVERMDDQPEDGEEEEEMEQATSNHHHHHQHQQQQLQAPATVIVSVSSSGDSESGSPFTSPSRLPTSSSSGHTPVFQLVSHDQHVPQHHLLSSKKHLQVRQTLSEPGRNGRGHKVKVARLSPTRLSPLQQRKNDLSKTVSMGAAIDSTGSGSVLWKPVEATGQHMIHGGVTGGAECMQAEAGEESPNNTPSMNPLTISAARIPFMVGVGTQLGTTGTQLGAGPQLGAVGTQLPSQEQLEALYKQIAAGGGSSNEQLMLALLEQQQKLASLTVPSLVGTTPTLAPLSQANPSGIATGTTMTSPAPSVSPGGAEMFQLSPLFLLNVPPSISPFSSLTPSSSASTNSSATPSPTSSTTSNDSGISPSNLAQFGITSLPLQPSGLSVATRDPLSLGGVGGGGLGGTSTGSIQQRRPLSESLSAPGYQSVQEQLPLDVLQKQYQLQYQQLLAQSQQIHQHYLDQQQRLVQQAALERKQFEEQQRQLSVMHLHQQSELQKKQQLLRQMQETQSLNLQRQQQMLLVQQTIQQQLQQQQQQRANQLVTTPSVPLSRRTQTSPQPVHKVAVHRAASKDSTSLPFSKSPLSASSSYSSLQDQGEIQGASRSPSVTPKALTPTNSYESVASNNGRLSPNVSIASPSSGQEPPQQMGTGLVYDSMMLKHGCTCGGSHPEHPGRLQSIWARLVETRVVSSCRRLRARKASLAELQSMHSENHVRLYGRPSQRKAGMEKKDSGRAFVQLSCGGVGVDRDTYWNDAHTSNASRMAVGSVIELADKVASGEVRNGFAFVRPPGHHALQNQAQAFCYFNNVALAAKAMCSKGRRVMIVDWDVHHGNGTQQMFYDNPNVLFLSIHRYDNGTFFPGTGRPDEIGSGAGLGFNMNVAFSGATNFQGMSVSNFGDPEYLAAFRSIVVPIGREFCPDLILVSAGFNATDGHPPTLGGYSVSPKCYAHMTRMLMGVGSGRVAMALEGGYELMTLCASAELCMKALLGLELYPLDSAALERVPHPSAQSSLEKTITCHKNYWQCLSHMAPLIPMSHLDAEKHDGVEESEAVSALASLSVGGDPRRRHSAAMQTSV